MGVTTNHAVANEQRSADDRARRFIRALLNGTAPGYKDPDSLGRWSEEAAALLDVLEHVAMSNKRSTHCVTRIQPS